MTLIIRNLTNDHEQTFKSLLDVPHRHLWAFQELVRDERASLIEGEVMYEIQESSDRYEFAP